MSNIAIVSSLSQFLILPALLTLTSLPTVLSDEFPLTQFPVFTQLTFQGRFCATSVSSTYRVSFGCDLYTPAACMCTDPASSLKIATALRECVDDVPASYSIISSVTQLWASYCLTNAGVSAQDEKILQDIPLFTQVTADVRWCANSVTNAYITQFGCDAYTKAGCLCGTSASSMAVSNAIGSCIGTYSPYDVQSASVLWSSYCDVNSREPAVRSIGAPVSVSATVTASGSGRTSTPARTSGLNSGPTSTQASQSQTSSSNGQGSSSSQSSGATIPWDAIGAIAGVVGVLVAVGIAWWTNRKNQWFQGVLGHLHLSQGHRPQHIPNAHPMHMRHPQGWV